MFAAHESQQTLLLVNSKPKTTSLQASLKPRDREITTKFLKPFSISYLPPELRNEIYAYYFASLPPLNITTSNDSSRLHRETQLSLSSPYFDSDILPSVFYQNCTFSFSSPKLLRQFAKGDFKESVAKVRIDYGRLSRCHHTDWIFLLFRYFHRLSEVTFILDTNGQIVDDGLFAQWWRCVRDATREAANSPVDGTGKSRETRILLKVECGRVDCL